MTHPELMKRIEELGEDYDVLLLEPRADYDQFIIGIAERGQEVVVLYDKDDILRYLAETADVDPGDEDQDPETMALEHYDFNMNQFGQGHPMYVLAIDRAAVS